MAIDKVKEYFAGFGMEDRVQEFEESSATVELAAKAVGVEPARICLLYTSSGLPWTWKRGAHQPSIHRGK